MPNVAAVRLTYNPKVLWFDPNGVEFRAGDALIVRTERGLEYGVADEDLKEVDDAAIKGLKCALKPVERKATAEDAVTWKSMQTKAADALPVFKQMVEEQGLDMHPVTVEFLFDGDKAVFYFEAEDRVDFRELVRSLAARFHVRIDMRQIGVRDEARIVGGLGHCGQELCCKRLGGEFNPVSIRMAKDQDLSLNPQKISGVCGRLMCCLRYEADTYKEFKTRCPKMNSMVSTPEGDAKVIEINVPRETVTILAGDKRVKIPVAEMDVDKKTGKPNAVPADVFEECANQNNANSAAVEMLVSPIFTGTDKLADRAGARRTGGAAEERDARKRAGRGSKSEASEQEKKPTRRRRRSSRVSGGESSTQDQRGQQSSRSGRSGSASQRGKQGQGQTQGQGGAKRPENSSRGNASRQQRNQGKPQQDGQAPRQRRGQGARPGQRSSGLSGASAQGSKKPAARRNEGASQQASRQQPPAAEHRKSRRRSHKAQGGETKQD